MTSCCYLNSRNRRTVLPANIENLVIRGNCEADNVRADSVLSETPSKAQAECYGGVPHVDVQGSVTNCQQARAMAHVNWPFKISGW